LLIVEPPMFATKPPRENEAAGSGTPSAVSKLIVPSWFVGRTHELSVLEDGLQRAGKSWGGVVVVSGPRGIGKSRLIREACTRTTVPIQTIDGDALLAEVFEKAFRSTALKALRESLHRTLDRASGAAPVVVFDGLNDDDRWMRESFREWDAFVPGFGARGMIVIGVRSASSTEVLEPPSIGEALERGGTHVKLGPLTEQEMQVFLRIATPPEITVSHALVARIQKLCEGNPELICDLLSGLRAVGDTAEHLNLSLASCLIAREQDTLAAANGSTRRFVTAAAIAGDVFDAALVGRIAELTSKSVREATGFLVAREVICAVPGQAQAFAFRRPLLREKIREGLIPALARRLHERFGNELERSAKPGEHLAERAYHWSQAQNRERALTMSEAAGDEAVVRGDFETAVRWYATALTFVDPKSSERLDRKRAEAIEKISRGTTLLTAFEELLSHADAMNPEDVAQVLLRAMISSQAECQMARAHAFAARIESLGLRPDGETLLYSRVIDANTYTHEQRYDEARALFKNVRPVKLRDAPYKRVYFHILWAIANLDRRAALRTYRRLERFIRVAETVGHPLQVSALLNIIAGQATIAGRLDDAKDFVRRAHLIAVASGAEDLIADCRLQGAETAFVSGDLATGRSQILSAMSCANDQTTLRVWFCLGIWLGLLLEDRALVEACANEQLIDTAFQSGTSLIAATAANYAQLMVVRGQRREAQALLKEALTRIRALTSCYWFTAVVAHHGAKEDLGIARDLLVARVQLNDDAAESFLYLFDAIVARRDRRWHHAAQAGLEAAARFKAMGAAYFEAQAFEAAGRTAQALEIYERIGDVRDAQRLARRRVTRGSERTALTRRESEVAALAASGLRSRAIAERLGLQARSVEIYLQRAYAKLGIHARQQLPPETP
jgi:DNA-binding CsgD family transcriptional regulator